MDGNMKVHPGSELDGPGGLKFGCHKPVMAGPNSEIQYNFRVATRWGRPVTAECEGRRLFCHADLVAMTFMYKLIDPWGGDIQPGADSIVTRFCHIT
jgi:hypothetical protein